MVIEHFVSGDDPGSEREDALSRTATLASIVALCLSLFATDALASGDKGAAGDAAADQEAEGPVNPYEIIEADPALWTHGWIALGVSGALLISGAVTGGLALSLDKELEDKCTGGVCEPGQHDDLDRRNRLARSSTILLGTGVVAALTGILVLAVFAPDEDAEPAKVALRPAASPAYAGASLEWRF